MEEIIRKTETDHQGNTIHFAYKEDTLIERITYNKKGEMVEEFYPGELRNCYIYDDNGDEIECNQFLIQDDGREEHAFQGFKKYDEEGRLIEYEYENAYDGHFHFTYKYETLEGKVLQKMYDQKGDLVGVELIEE
jgi:hypothetical protein